MTADISIQNKPLVPEQAKPALKIAAHPISETNTDTVVTEVDKIEERAEEKELSKQDLDQAVKQMNRYVQTINRSLEFKVDNDSGETIVKVIDSDTEELIRQIPNEEALHIAKQLEMDLSAGDKDPGLLLIKAQA